MVSSLTGQKSRISDPRYNKSRGTAKAFKSERSKSVAAHAKQKNRFQQQFARHFAVGSIKR